MARPKKSVTVTEEVTTTPAEEVKPAKRRGRPRKNPLPEETQEIPVKAEKSAEETKQPAKRGRKKSTEKEAAPAPVPTPAEEVKPAKRGRKKAEPVKEIRMIVQYGGNQIEEKDMLAKVEHAWKAEGNKTPIETITMYVKPEDGKIYYVVNGLSGSVDLF